MPLIHRSPETSPRKDYMTSKLPRVHALLNGKSLHLSVAIMRKLQAMGAEYVVLSRFGNELQIIPLTEEGLVGVARVKSRVIGNLEAVQRLGIQPGASAKAVWREGAFCIDLKALQAEDSTAQWEAA